MIECPECGSEDFATVEDVAAHALLNGINDDGTYEFFGTTVYGDGETVTNEQGWARVACRACSHEWWLDDTTRPARLVT